MTDAIRHQTESMKSTQLSSDLKTGRLPAKGGGDSFWSSIMAKPGNLGQVDEITYTPTIHRISKAKKDKKVFTCEFPECTKVSWLDPPKW